VVHQLTGLEGRSRHVDSNFCQNAVEKIENLYIPVDFEASLTHAKSNEIFATGCEFAKKTWRFFHIDQSIVWVDIHVKTASRVNQFAPVVSRFGSGRWAMDFPHKQSGNHIL
jgi:hypothetical protein